LIAFSKALSGLPGRAFGFGGKEWYSENQSFPRDKKETAPRLREGDTKELKPNTSPVIPAQAGIPFGFGTYPI